MLIGMGRNSRGWGMRGLAGSCPIFPANNVWNTPIAGLPIHSSSPAWIASIGANAVMRLDDTLPVNYVSAVQGMATVTPGDGNSDFGAAPIPANPVMEPGSDGHLLIVDEDNCTLYEMYQASGSGTNWTAGSGKYHAALCRRGITRPDDFHWKEPAMMVGLGDAIACPPGSPAGCGGSTSTQQVNSGATAPTPGFGDGLTAWQNPTAAITAVQNAFATTSTSFSGTALPYTAGLLTPPAILLLILMGGLK